MTDAIEVNFDGLVGLTHNYGGLSHGNIASQTNQAQISHPKKAALEGLAKAWKLAQAGLVQGILPPHERPFLPALRRLGFDGTDAQILQSAWRTDPRLVANIGAASAMWAANAATISPSNDCADGRLHASPANLITMAHRAIEVGTTTKCLRRLLENYNYFEVHDPLPAHALFADEGAANHMRMCAEHGEAGLEIFVYGRNGFDVYQGKFPARQTLQTGQAIARRHGLMDAFTIHLEQGQSAIAAGAFHNDVVAIANKHVLFFHELAFENKLAALEAIKNGADGLFEPCFIEVSEAEVSIKDAIKSYLFNTQLLEIPNTAGRMTLIAPMECFETPSVKNYLDKLVAGNGPIGAVQYVDVRQSMNNGGGPACLRLRMVFTPEQIGALGGNLILNANLYDGLCNWVDKHYRDELSPNQLADPQLLNEGRIALDELTMLLNLGGGFYDFQKDA